MNDATTHLDLVPAHKEVELHQLAMATAKKFMPEARKIFKAETGKACPNFATERVLTEFFKSVYGTMREPQ